MQASRRGLLKARAQEQRERSESGRRGGGEPIFEITPEPFDEMEFWCIGRKEEQAAMGRVTLPCSVEMVGAESSALHHEPGKSVWPSPQLYRVIAGMRQQVTDG